MLNVQRQSLERIKESISEMFQQKTLKCQAEMSSIDYEGKSIKIQPTGNLFLGEIDLFFFDVIAL